MRASREDTVAGEAFYRGLRQSRSRFEYKTCRRCHKHDAPHLAGRNVCITCREARPHHKHRSKHGHARKNKRSKYGGWRR